MSIRRGRYLEHAVHLPARSAPSDVKSMWRASAHCLSTTKTYIRKACDVTDPHPRHAAPILMVQVVNFTKLPETFSCTFLFRYVSIACMNVITQVSGSILREAQVIFWLK